MDKIATENLFLLEFLVDKVRLDPSVTNDVGDMMGDTCVSVQFLDNAPLDICEDDFNPKRQYSSDCGNIKSGKSCLFSLTPCQAEQAIQQFDVYLTIFKKMQPGVLPEKIQIGNTLISIVNLFNELISSIANSNNSQAPTAKTLKDTFKITNANGQYIGDIGMYIRMSCFGKLIVTQFQMNLDDKSVLFKDKEGHSLYRYKKAGSKREASAEGRGNSSCPSTPCPRPNQPSPQQQSANMVTPCNECSQSIVPQQFGAAGQDPPGCYQEIGASMGGNALTIRVHKEKNKVEQMDDETDEDSDCVCTAGNVGGSKRRSKQYASGGGGGGGGGGGSCQMQQQNLAMRPGAEPNNPDQPFSFKMGGCGTAAANNVTVVPPVCTAPDGTQYTELSDPNRDVFILRIGKKSEGADKKNNLELELCTPKAPDTKPPPKKETRDTQWDDADALAAGGGGKDGKKGGKGGKGKGGNRGGSGDKAREAGLSFGGPGNFIGEPKPKSCNTPKVRVCCNPSYMSCPDDDYECQETQRNLFNSNYNNYINNYYSCSSNTAGSTDNYCTRHDYYDDFSKPRAVSCRMWS